MAGVILITDVISVIPVIVSVNNLTEVHHEPVLQSNMVGTSNEVSCYALLSPLM